MAKTKKTKIERMQDFYKWYKHKIQNVNIITTKEFERIIEKF